ncbi:hypothetical protein CDAR_96031 [Caerostris darwini]|uniref:Secreted protein n=1 Tax=Caerostris darwini TaxID=1538125 RepID=A0AAV4UQF9_9ARAC|nr:hypothetical protein CDAR_96031 [Caerostris darwini]
MRVLWEAFLSLPVLHSEASDTPSRWACRMALIESRVDWFGRMAVPVKGREGCSGTHVMGFYRSGMSRLVKNAVPQIPSLFLSLQEFCDLFDCRNSVISFTSHITSGSMKQTTHSQLHMNAFECLTIRLLPPCKSFPANPWSSRLISICSSTHEMHFGDCRIGVKMHSARNLCGEG